MHKNHWLRYIERLSPGVKLGLERLRDVARPLKLTQFDCPVVTVAGTNGKGSCVRALEALYLAGGFRVGAYTSPHLMCFNERIRLNGVNVDDKTLCQAFSTINHVRQQLPLTYFEFITLAALDIFKHANIDILLLEVGLGGRRDAVNIVNPNVAVITSIGLDHCAWLGEDLESIGREKAGIMREKVPIVLGSSAMPRSVLSQAATLSAPTYQLSANFSYEKRQKTWDWRGIETNFDDLAYPNLPLPSVACALMSVELLAQQLPLDTQAIHQALTDMSLPGRFELLSWPCQIIFDVAHNPPAAQWLCQRLRETKPLGKTLAIVGMLADKDIRATLGALTAEIDVWYALDLSNKKGALSYGASASELSTIIHAISEKPCYNFADCGAELDDMIANCSPHDRIVVFGSFFTVACIKQILANQMQDQSPAQL